MKTLEWENFGIKPTEKNEMQVIREILSKRLRAGGWTYLTTQIIDHWVEIKQSFVKGYQAKI